MRLYHTIPGALSLSYLLWFHCAYLSGMCMHGDGGTSRQLLSQSLCFPQSLPPYHTARLAVPPVYPRASLHPYHTAQRNSHAPCPLPLARRYSWTISPYLCCAGCCVSMLTRLNLQFQHLQFLLFSLHQFLCYLATDTNIVKMIQLYHYFPLPGTAVHSVVRCWPPCTSASAPQHVRLVQSTAAQPPPPPPPPPGMPHFSKCAVFTTL